MSANDTVTVTLKHPVKHDDGDGEKTWTTLTFQEATVGDLMTADTFPGETGKIAAVLASVAGIPMPAFRKIRLSDMNRILDQAGHLAGNAKAPLEGGGA